MADAATVSGRFAPRAPAVRARSARGACGPVTYQSATRESDEEPDGVTTSPESRAADAAAARTMVHANGTTCRRVKDMTYSRFNVSTRAANVATIPAPNAVRSLHEGGSPSIRAALSTSKANSAPATTSFPARHRPPARPDR